MVFPKLKYYLMCTPVKTGSAWGPTNFVWCVSRFIKRADVIGWDIAVKIGSKHTKIAILNESKKSELANCTKVN